MADHGVSNASYRLRYSGEEMEAHRPDGTLSRALVIEGSVGESEKQRLLVDAKSGSYLGFWKGDVQLFNQNPIYEDAPFLLWSAPERILDGIRLDFNGHEWLLLRQGTDRYELRANLSVASEGRPTDHAVQVLLIEVHATTRLPKRIEMRFDTRESSSKPILVMESRLLALQAQESWKPTEAPRHPGTSGTLPWTGWPPERGKGTGLTLAEAISFARRSDADVDALFQRHDAWVVQARFSDAQGVRPTTDSPLPAAWETWEFVAATPGPSAMRVTVRELAPGVPKVAADDATRSVESEFVDNPFPDASVRSHYEMVPLDDTLERCRQVLSNDNVLFEFVERLPQDPSVADLRIGGRPAIEGSAAYYCLRGGGQGLEVAWNAYSGALEMARASADLDR